MKLQNKIHIQTPTKDIYWQNILGEQSQVANREIIRQYMESITMLPTPFRCKPNSCLCAHFEYVLLSHTWY